MKKRSKLETALAILEVGASIVMIVVPATREIVSLIDTKRDALEDEEP